MRRFLIILCGLLLVVLCLGLFIFWQGNRREKTMPDGSSIRIEKAAFGPEEHIRLGGPIEKLKTMLLQFWHARFGGPRVRSMGNSSWYQNAVIHTNEPALFIYISRRQPGKGYRNVDAQSAQLIDEDGCIFLPTQSGGWDDGILPSATPGSAGGMVCSLGWFRFEAFPRREKNLRFVVYDGGFGKPPGKRGHVEFTIANPAPAPKPADWATEPLPVTRTQDGVSFILARATIKTNESDRPRFAINKSFSARFEYKEDGRPSTNWQEFDEELYDISGNFVSEEFDARKSLCPLEPAWKLRAKFFGSENSRAASNAVWTLSGLAVPASGKTTLLNRSHELQGVLVKAVTFGGVGVFTYSNGIALEATQLKDPFANNSSTSLSWPRNWNGKGSVARPTFDLHTKGPHLALEVGDLSENQRLTVRAVDDQGREFYGHKVNDWGSGSPEGDESQGVQYLKNWESYEGSFIIFELPADAKTVDLTFCVHTCRTAEFIFKPPQPKP